MSAGIFNRWGFVLLILLVGLLAFFAVDLQEQLTDIVASTKVTRGAPGVLTDEQLSAATHYLLLGSGAPEAAAFDVTVADVKSLDGVREAVQLRLKSRGEAEGYPALVLTMERSDGTSVRSLAFGPTTYAHADTPGDEVVSLTVERRPGESRFRVEALRMSLRPIR